MSPRSRIWITSDAPAGCAGKAFGITSGAALSGNALETAKEKANALAHNVDNNFLIECTP